MWLEIYKLVLCDWPNLQLECSFQHFNRNIMAHWAYSLSKNTSIDLCKWNWCLRSRLQYPGWWCWCCFDVLHLVWCTTFCYCLLGMCSQYMFIYIYASMYIYLITEPNIGTLVPFISLCEEKKEKTCMLCKMLVRSTLK